MKNRLDVLQIVVLFFCLLGGEARAQIYSEIAPIYGPVGTSIAIIAEQGNQLYASTVVRLNEVVLPVNYVAADGTQIRALVPTGATSGTITVQNPGQPNRWGYTSFVVTDTRPYIVSFSPTNGTHSTPVTINGGNFAQNNIVYFGGISVSATTTVYNKLTVNPPNGALTGKIAVYNTTYGTGNSLGTFYAEPYFTSWSPSNAPVGATVKITGTNFLGISSLKIGTLSVFPTNIDNNHVSFVVPQGAVDGKLSITTPAMTIQSAKIFAVLPTITGFTPTNGSVGTTVSITGINFSDVKSVLFNSGKPGTVTSSNATAISVKVPTNAITGPITLVTPYGNVTTTNVFHMPPIIYSINRGWGDPGTKVIITGSNFVNVSSVKFNGSSAFIFTNYSSTCLTSTVPVRATVGPITITTPGGTTTSSNTFWPPPVIDSFTPSAGVAGLGVQLTGLGFDYYTNISFNRASAKIATNTSAQATVIVPTNATTGFITVNRDLGGGIGYYGATSSVPFRIDILKLLIQKVDPNLVSISWPTSALGYQLEYVAEFQKSNSWILSTNTPKVSGNGTGITVPDTDAPRFYRLKSP